MVLLEAHKSTSQRQKRLMNVITLLITNAQTPKTVQPCVSAFHHPAPTTRSFSVVNAPADNTWLDNALLQHTTTHLKVITLIRMHLVRAKPRTPWLAATNWHNGINNLFQNEMIVDVGSRQHRRQRRAPRVYDKMMFGSLLATIGRTRTYRLGNVVFERISTQVGNWCPLFSGVEDGTGGVGACGAAILAESTLARDQSNWFA